MTNEPAVTAPDPYAWLTGGGELGERVRTKDWAETPLGPLEAWPPCLLATVALLLASGVPMLALWGSDLVQLYNDGYRDLLGRQHPAGLGQPARVCWPELWPLHAPLYQRVLAGETLIFVDARSPLSPPREREAARFTLSYSPLRDEAGRIAGVLVSLVETTAKRPAAARPENEERQRAEERQTRDALLLAHVRESIIVTDLQGIITFWNEGATRLFGYEAGEMLGRLYWERLPEPSRREVAAWIGKIAHAGAEFQGEWLDYRKDGSRVWIQATTRLLRDAAGRALGIMGLAHDLTARKQGEAALQASEKRFRTIADAVPQVIWTNTPDGTANYFNQRWFDYSGVPYEEAHGQGWQTIVHPEDAPASVPEWQHALTAGETFEAEYRLRRADGAYRWHLGRNVPLKDGEGQVLGWFGTATDIEELKQAQAAQRESQERFRLLVEGARDYAMLLLDAAGRITFWSLGAERLFGWTEAEALGQPGSLVFTPEDRERGEPERELQTARTVGRALDRRWHFRRDGSRLWVDGILMRLEDEADGLRGFAKVTRDATEQKRAEEEREQALAALAAANAHLEERVEQRTGELARMSAQRQELLRQLVTVQEEERGRVARDLYDGTGQLVTGLLLELTNLMNLVPVRAEPAIHPRLDHLRELAQELARKSHQLAFALRPITLDDHGLEAALTLYAEEWSRWSGIPAEVAVVGLETQRLPLELETTIYRVAQEALTNILRHAVSAKKEPPVRQVSLLIQQRAGEVVTTVEDDGPGFEVEAVLNLPPGERRLGIFGMQERARLAGGTLTVESEPGHGTTVHLRLPLPHPWPRAQSQPTVAAPREG